MLRRGTQVPWVHGGTTLWICRGFLRGRLLENHSWPLVWHLLCLHALSYHPCTKKIARNLGWGWLWLFVSRNVHANLAFSSGNICTLDATSPTAALWRKERFCGQGLNMLYIHTLHNFVQLCQWNTKWEMPLLDLFRHSARWKPCIALVAGSDASSKALACKNNTINTHVHSFPTLSVPSCAIALRHFEWRKWACWGRAGPVHWFCQ